MKQVGLLFALFCLTQARFIPDYLKELTCHKSNPQFEKCILENTLKAYPYLVKGVPELGYPPLDPLEVAEVNIDTVLSDTTSFKGKITNSKTYGLSDIVIEGLKGNPYNLTGELRLRIPQLYCEFDYDVEGKFIGVPINSKGKLVGTFTDIVTAMKGKLKTIQIDGVKHFKVDRLQTKSVVGNGRVSIKSATNDPELEYGAKLVENIYNENPRLFMDIINPYYVKFLNEATRNGLDAHFADFSTEELLPE